MTQYPGEDPDDPFAKPPRESGTQSSGDETGPIGGRTPTPGAPSADQPGYWEQQAQQGGQQGPESGNPWAGYGQPAGTPPPPPPPAGSSPAAPPYGQPYGQPAYGQQPGYGYAAPPPNHPNSTTALVLGIISIACCFVAGPFAWWIGGKARREIKESNGQLGGEGGATAGWIMGIIATVLLVLAIVAVVLVVVIAVSTGSSSTYDY